MGDSMVLKYLCGYPFKTSHIERAGSPAFLPMEIYGFYSISFLLG